MGPTSEGLKYKNGHSLVRTECLCEDLDKCVLVHKCVCVRSLLRGSDPLYDMPTANQGKKGGIMTTHIRGPPASIFLNS